MILLSILIPVYNAERYLVRCLDSIVKQHFFSDSVEIITVNDGSTDSSLSILNKYAEEYHNIQVISQENKGIGFTRNVLLRHTSGKYFWFIDADDYISKESLEQIVNLLVRGKYDMLLLSYYWGTEKEGQYITYSGEYSSGYDITKNGIYNNSVWTRVYKTDIIKQDNLYFELFQMGEDFDFIFKTTPHVGLIKCIELPLYNYIVNPNSAITEPSMNHKERSSEHSLLCMQQNYMSLTIYSSKEQTVLRIALNGFLFGYLYSIYVVPFSLRYKMKSLKRLKEMGAIPISPLPMMKKRRWFCVFLT